MAVGNLLSYFISPCKPEPRLPLDPRNTSSLLLLRLDGVGDNVCSWPALKLLREQLPDTRISLAVGPWTAQLYSECPWIDEVIEWDSGLFGLFRGKGVRGVMHDLEMTSALKKRGFTVGIDLRGDLLSIALLRLIAPPIRVSTVTRGGSRLLTDPLHIRKCHETERTFTLAATLLGMNGVETPTLHDWQRPHARERAQRKLIDAGWKEQVPSVALCPLALWHWKQWPKERFHELASRLKQAHGVQIIWFLEHEEQAREYDSNDTIFCGPLDEVAAAFSFCSLAVSNDSGLMHLAVAAGCSTVQLFGPGDAAQFAHHGDTVAIHHITDCAYYPCTRSGSCKSLTSTGWCMDKICVDDVFASCQQLMTRISA